MMPDQPQSPQFSIAELGAPFGSQLAEVYAEIITLKKQLTAQTLFIEKMTKNEERQQNLIQDLEAELSALKLENFELNEAKSLVDALKISEAELGARVQGLEAELTEIRTAAKNPDMPTRLSTAGIAEEAKAIREDVGYDTAAEAAALGSING